MMLWLLATLSVVTMSWGIAHRLKAGSEACTEPERRFANPRTGTLRQKNSRTQNPEPIHIRRTIFRHTDLESRRGG